MFAKQTLLLFLLSPGVALAATGDADEDLDEIVVTATRMESTLRSIPRAVSVADKSRIQDATRQLSLDESLSGVPGLYLQNSDNFAQDMRVSLRGFGARSSFGIRGVRIVVDDIPETLPDGQAQVDSIDLGSAEQIEVLRGPASSLYGNASGGVISVRSELGADPDFAELRLAAGDFGFSKVQFKATGGGDALDYLLNVSRQEIDGYREHSRAEGTMVNGRLGLDLTERDRLLIALNLADQPVAQDPGGINASQAASDPSSARDQNVLFDAGEDLSQQRLGLVWRRDNTRSSVLVRTHYVWRDFSNLLPFTDGGAVTIDRNFYGAGFQYTGNFLADDALRLTTGFDVDRQDDERKRYDNNAGTRGNLVFDQNERVSSDGVYLTGRYALTTSLSLEAGVRADRINFDVTDHFLIDGDDSGSIDFNETSPSLGLIADFGSASLFASYSRSFETPTTTELANPDGSGGFDESLKAQTADSFELGFRGTRANLYYEIVAFTMDLDDELVPYEIPAFPGRTFFANAGKSSRNGLETLLRWENDAGLHAEVSWTWSDFTYDVFVDDSGTDFAGMQLPGLPRQFAYARVGLDDGSGFYGSFEARYSGSLYANNANDVSVDSYVVANLRIGYRFSSGRWNVEPFVGVNNIFDESYNSNIRINAFGGRYFEPAPVRNWFAGIVTRFE